MKKILFYLLLLTGFTAQAQVYNNEWIDHSKTYFKFKVGKDGLYRIPQAALTAVGLGSTAAEHFQLWRNGVQVPLFTSVGTGVFSGADYIEFWGQMNDGKPDNALYRQPEYQLNDKWSLQTDTAIYFLTVNAAGGNLRLTPATTTTSGNTLTPEPYFMHTVRADFRIKINNGFAIPVGNEYLYSSSYDKGEGWSSGDIGTNASLALSFTNLAVSTDGPDPSVNVTVSGNAIRSRYYKVTINNDSIIRERADHFNHSNSNVSFPLSLLNSNTAAVQITNQCNEDPCPGNDRMVVHKFDLTYPRQFNFGGASNFEFSLPANASGSYLEITNFSAGGIAPLLYDLTNGKRYITDFSNPSQIKVVLEPSATARKLVLISQAATLVNAVNSLQSKTFINFATSNNQADYLIISNSLIVNTAVEEYRGYRASAMGGGFNTKVYLVDELTDQFAFGIKKHPLAIRNFLLFARQRFAITPKHVFLIGKGVNYLSQRGNEANPDLERLNLVPTFGWPASDILLTANPGSSAPEMSIGRLSVVNNAEISLYLTKIKEMESAQAVLSPNRADREWMKNVVHLNGISEPEIKPVIDNYYSNYKKIISDTLFGGNVTTFTKTSTNAVEQISSTYLQTLFRQGISLMTYFGHSSATTLEFNLENPGSYDNKGKYPLFIALGCNAGNFFNFNINRFQGNETISERYVLIKDKGTSGFIASTHFGIIHYLDIWNTRFYRALAASDYGQPVGELMKVTGRRVLDYTSQFDFYARANVEETTFHGDPAMRINPHAKPDYVIDEPLVKISPEFVSVAEPFFTINAKFVNIGKAINKNIVVEVKREYPNAITEVVFRDTIPGIRYADSIRITLPIDALRDKGTNKVTIAIDADNTVDEFYETNNSITKEIVIYEDELKPVYPNDFAIINKQNIKFIATTANPFADSKQYRFEMDTTALFNSSLKVTRTVNSPGGIVEFEPGGSFTENTVYYWRVAQVPPTGDFKWNTSSFIYLPGHDLGYNQSHLYQNFRSTLERITLDSISRIWRYNDVINNLYIKHGVWGTSTGQEGDIVVNVNEASYIRNTCTYGIIFNVFDAKTFKPLLNNVVGGQGQFGSVNPCHWARVNNFEFSINDSGNRRKAMEFLRQVSDNNYVVVRIQPRSDLNSNDYVDTWKQDAFIYGAANTLYDELMKNGVFAIDSFYRPRAIVGVFQKGRADFDVKQVVSEGLYDLVTLSVDATSRDSVGYLTSPVFGPAKTWKNLYWQGKAQEETIGDHPRLEVIGYEQTGASKVLLTNITSTQQIVDLSLINAAQYPRLQLRMQNADTSNFTPYQLSYWRVTYTPVPEGALAPNVHFTMKDTLEIGQPLDFKVAFKNISDTPFDSIKVKMVITDANNVQHVLPMQRHRPLGANNDTIHIRHYIDTRALLGINSLYVEVNPDNDQPEQYHFNNFAFRTFYVLGDSLNPMLDVTFDNVHILNNDIVSSRPDIVIKLKDDARWNLLDDTSLVRVQVRFPNGTIKSYGFNNDTLRFTPANSAENTATINFTPSFEEDGTYELIISGKDKSNNRAGTADYRVSFEVINKAMISNLLNYPNPFTTSTAFVFTLTGNEVPEEFKIQVLTVTGKIVREITKQELGPIHIGRNITEFKWDGTDQFGQKLANGVYIYRVVTSLNGKTLDKYKASVDNTDKFFNKGYGKMYLMR